MTCPSPDRRRRSAAALLAVAVFGSGWGIAPAPAVASSGEDPPTVAPAPEVDSLDEVSAPVRDIDGVVREIVTTTESVDGGEAKEESGTTRTVILEGKVLFAEESARITGRARRRLSTVADEVVDSGATGTVQVDGYTDDQGSAQVGLRLSRRRAAAVQDVLAPLLADADVQIATKGYGEADPRFANNDEDGDPIPENQARNRRVEITFTPAG